MCLAENEDVSSLAAIEYAGTFWRNQKINPHQGEEQNFRGPTHCDSCVAACSAGRWLFSRWIPCAPSKICSQRRRRSEPEAARKRSASFSRQASLFLYIYCLSFCLFSLSYLVLSFSYLSFSFLWSSLLFYSSVRIGLFLGHRVCMYADCTHCLRGHRHAKRVFFFFHKRDIARHFLHCSPRFPCRFSMFHDFLSVPHRFRSGLLWVSCPPPFTRQDTRVLTLFFGFVCRLSGIARRRWTMSPTGPAPCRIYARGTHALHKQISELLFRFFFFLHAPRFACSARS